MVRLLRSFGWALSGIRFALATQLNMKIHLVAAIAVIVVCAILKLPPVELALVVLLIFLVLAAEMFNTAIETVVDICSPERNPMAKTAKDVAAGAVLFTATVAVVVAVIIIWPRLRELIAR